MTELVALPGGKEWRVGDTTFVFDYGRNSSADRFLIRKPPGLINRYAELARRFEGANIVELGIAAGGGTALLSLLARPHKLICCELDAEPVEGLTEFIEAHGLASVVRPFYGIDQGDRSSLKAAIDSVIPGQAIDLVIDDASHLYDETRSSFELLFPRVRPGGLFIIEDWAADYAYATRIEATLGAGSAASAALQERLAHAVAQGSTSQHALPRIGVELLQVCGSSQGVVNEITVNRHWIAVERGVAELDPDRFRLADHYTDHWRWLSD